MLDEVQRCPALLSWVQLEVDERRRMGDFVLTGSAQFDLLAGITQSLAGRVGRVELLPLSGAELGPGGLPDTLDAALLKGATPPCTTVGCRRTTGLLTTWRPTSNAMCARFWRFRI